MDVTQKIYKEKRPTAVQKKNLMLIMVSRFGVRKCRKGFFFLLQKCCRASQISERSKCLYSYFDWYSHGAFCRVFNVKYVRGQIFDDGVKMSADIINVTDAEKCQKNTETPMNGGRRIPSYSLVIYCCCLK